MYSMRGSHCLSSLTSLKLYLSNETDVKDWLLLSPNLEKLSVRAIQPEDDSWDAAGCPVKLEKLRYLKLDGPLSALQILSLISETFFFDVRSCTHFAFRVVLCRRYESTSLHHRSGMHHSPLTAATPNMLFKVLSLKHADTKDAGSDTVRVLPELESLELIRFALPFASFLEFIASRWKVKERRLKRVKLTRCSISITRLYLLCRLRPGKFIDHTRCVKIVHGRGASFGNFLNGMYV